ncbi:MAG: hypothetical protein ACUVTE_03845 [Candidatus Bathycorpusculaceae bacterium]
MHRGVAIKFTAAYLLRAFTRIFGQGFTLPKFLGRVSTQHAFFCKLNSFQARFWKKVRYRIEFIAEAINNLSTHRNGFTINRNRKRKSQRTYDAWQKDPNQNSDGGQVLNIIAARIGTSRETLNEALWLMENAPKEELEKLRSGESAISNLYKETKRWKAIDELKAKAKTLKAPEGLFDVIVVDPPLKTPARFKCPFQTLL